MKGARLYSALMMNEVNTADYTECFACGRKTGKTPQLVDTRDDQLVYVGSECFKLIKAAGEGGYQPPKGGPRLWLSAPVRRETRGRLMKG